MARRTAGLVLLVASSVCALRAPLAPMRTASRTSRAPRMLIDAAQTFEPQFSAAQAAVALGAIGLPFSYWWYITVPEARIALARDKRLEGGETRAFIAELDASAKGERRVERWFFSKWLKQAAPRRSMPAAAEPAALETPAQRTQVSPILATVAEIEPAAVSADERRDPGLAELFTPASLRGNATPAFFSGDNPIVVTMGALMLAGLAAGAARANAPLALDGAVLGAGIVFGLTRLQLK